MSRLVFLDTETTGLLPDEHDVWEIAWAAEDGPVESRMVMHNIRNADPKALDLNGYRDRFRLTADIQAYDESEIRQVLAGATLVCSNPSFDTSFLYLRWDAQPWHHRKVDIATYAMPALRADRPVGLAKVAEHFGVEAPDHTAAGDVEVMRQCYRRLSDLYALTFGAGS